MRNFIKKSRNVLLEFTSFEGSLFRYSLAFSLLLALLPILIVLVMLFNQGVLDIQVLLNFLYSFIPETFIEGFVDYIMDQNYPNISSFIVSLVVALHLASRSVYSFMLITAEKEEINLPKFIIRIKAYIVFLGLIAIVVGVSFLSGIIGFSSGWVSFMLMVLLFYILYRVLTFVKHPILFGLEGAIATSIVLLLLSRLFQTIIEYFTSYQSIYGPMATLIISVMAIYVLSSVIYLGYCINLVFGESYETQEYKHPKLYERLLKIEVQVKSKIKGIAKR
ncbi:MULTISPECIES: YhjD/YihY/BrkB family envelope integrity protein [unclassified Breznakia]|uniref:YihY/virulence factor BrkB family protein n=1 Tax=unclassified Breznakia TaxID=2623764 RepID=UPI002474351B|nr:MULTISPECIES: YhjD/YihY/BrkB family envelope integrity protein [unclassified Breznakia]MDH6367968.1 membrane protein [Breznakia sp. PH1-1]MDH6405056.1 membrane protein [Breznakia sp. PF1-11]MDH6412775.1 membrane protein [Breznakia sp. PFB1-11]MDH6415131.1 membrane protein [Breznakia sp. PFB1-14]MDH6417446.1 membrane protein [Breznakia sp. PFB1-4]